MSVADRKLIDKDRKRAEQKNRYRRFATMFFDLIRERFQRDFEQGKQILYAEPNDQQSIIYIHENQKQKFAFLISQSLQCNDIKELEDVKIPCAFTIDSCDVIREKESIALFTTFDFTGYVPLDVVLTELNQYDATHSDPLLKSNIAISLFNNMKSIHETKRLVGPMPLNTILIKPFAFSVESYFLTLNHYKSDYSDEEFRTGIADDRLRLLYTFYYIQYWPIKEEPPQFVIFATSEPDLWTNEVKQQYGIHKGNGFKNLEVTPVFKIDKKMKNRKGQSPTEEKNIQSDSLPKVPLPTIENPPAYQLKEEKKASPQIHELEIKDREMHTTSNSHKEPLDPLEKEYNNLTSLSDEQKGQIRHMLEVLSRGGLLDLQKNEENFTELGKQIEKKIPAVKVLEFWLSDEEIFGYLQRIKQANSLAWNGAEFHIPFYGTVKKPGFKDKFIAQMDDKSIADKKMTNAQEIIQYYDILQKRVHVKIDDLKQDFMKQDYGEFISKLFVKNFKKRKSPAKLKELDANTLERKVSPKPSGANSSKHKSDPKPSRANFSEQKSGTRGSRANSRASQSQRRKSAQPTGIPPDESFPCDVPATTRLHCIKDCQNMSDVPYPFRVKMNFRDGRSKYSKCYNIQTLYEYRDSLIEFKWWKDHPNSFMKNQRDFIETQYKWLHTTQVKFVFNTLNYLLSDQYDDDPLYQLSYDKDGETNEDDETIEFTQKKMNVNNRIEFTQKKMNVNNRRYLKTRLFMNGEPVLEINGCGYSTRATYNGKFSLFNSKFDYAQYPIAIANNNGGEVIRDLVKDLLQGKPKYRDTQTFDRVYYEDRYGKREVLRLPFGLTLAK